MSTLLQRSSDTENKKKTTKNFRLFYVFEEFQKQSLLAYDVKICKLKKSRVI